MAKCDVKRMLGILGGMALVFAALMLASCATWKPTRLPGGQAGYRVDCSGPSLSWSHCYRKAGLACPHGYDIARKSDKGGGHIVAGDLFDLVGDKVRHRRLLIACRSSGIAHSGAAPASVHPPVAKPGYNVMPPST